MLTSSLLFFVLFVATHCQSSDSISSFFNLIDTVTISASKNNQSLRKAPAKIIVIDHQQILKRGYSDLEEILHDLPGFDFNKGMGVNWSTIFMRGIRSDNSDKFLLIWDDIVQNDIWKQTTWPSRQYPISNIDRIEVMYGPSSLLYGSNAFSGIINVILKKESDIDGFQVLQSLGSFNTKLSEINFGKEIQDWRFSFNGRIFTSDNMSFDNKYWTDNIGRKRYYTIPQDSYGQHFADTQALLKQNANGQYTVTKNGQEIVMDGLLHNTTNDWFYKFGVGYKNFDFTLLKWNRQESEDPWYVMQNRIDGNWTPTGSAMKLDYKKKFSKFEAKSSFTYRVSGLDWGNGKSTDPSSASGLNV